MKEKGWLFNHFQNNQGAGIAKYPHYFDIYEHNFQKFVDKPVNILEIGVGECGALLMWKEYFGPEAKLYGLDYRNIDYIDDPQIEFLQGDQADVDFLKEVKEKCPKFDLIMDDGGHSPHQQITSFIHLFDHLNEGGIYSIEEAHGSCIEYFKDHIDYLYGYYDTDRGDLSRDYSRQTYSINFYNNMIVIEKRDKSQTHRSPYRTGSWKWKEKHGF